MTSGWASWRLQPWMLRRLALFLAMLMSGGILLIPRIPVLMLVVVLSLAATDNRLPIRRAFWPLYTLLGLVMAGAVLHPQGVALGPLATRYANFAAALLLLNMYARSTPGALVGDLLAVLRLMAIQAIGTVVLAHTVGFLFVPLDFSRVQYRTLLLLFTYHITIEDAGGLVRPDGFFFEPGVFQIYLNLYLYLTLFMVRNGRQAALAGVAVLSTQSTTGMLICLVLVGAAFVRSLRQGSRRTRRLAVVAALLVAPGLLYLSYDNLHDKFFGELQGSSWSRQYDLFTGLNILSEHPLVGIGFDVGRYQAAAQLLGYEDTELDPQTLEERSTSNGLMQMFTSIGIPLGLAFLVGIARQRFFPDRWLISLWFLLSMFGEALVFTPFFLLIAFSGFVAVRRAARRPPRPLVATADTATAATSAPPAGALAAGTP